MHPCGCIFWYNVIMEYITIVTDSFWLIMTQCAQIFTPIIAIYIVFRLVKSAIRG